MLPLMPPELFTQDPPFEMAFTLNDGPISVVHDTFKERSEKLGRAGKVWPKAQLDKAEQGMRWTHGWYVRDRSRVTSDASDCLLHGKHVYRGWMRGRCCMMTVQ
jgi:hypothetical protein